MKTVIPGSLESFKALCEFVDLQTPPTKSKGRRSSGGMPTLLNIQSHLSLELTKQVLASLAPASGGRHAIRLAGAGWMLKRGVSKDVTSATIESAIPSSDGPAEIEAAVRTTYNRLHAGQVVSGLGRLVKSGLITNKDAKKLNEALDEDLINQGLEPESEHYWGKEARQVILEAATLAKHNKVMGQRGKRIRSGVASLRQMGYCSRMFMRAKECGGCKDAITQSPMHCDRAGCMYCANRKAEAWIQWVKAFWKGIFADGPIYYAKIPVTFHAAGKKEPRPDNTYNRAVKVRDRLFKRLDKNCARRAWVAPGYVLVVMDANAYKRRGMSIDGEHGQVTSLGMLAGLIGQVKEDIFEHLAGYVRKKDAFGLSQDDWVTARKIVSANKTGNVRFPWFDDFTLRAFKAALRKSQEEVQEFVKNLLAASGAANRKIAVKNWKQEQANECSEYCQKCGPFEESRWVVYHRQSRRVIFRGMPGDPLPSFSKVCRLWIQMETAPVQVVDPPTVSYARRN